ncbi:MAG TPA: IS110 family transposase, partial [Rhodocyclaceae bacterium]|nr:IS110 family transposase [Rhodocyclaceae bacterium]
MEELKVVGLDLAKSVFQVHGMNDEGRKRCGKKLGRSEVVAYFARLPPTLVGMEACGGAHHWARTLSGLGHQVKLMAPQHVKPFVQGNKTDARDAAAIAEAATRQSVPRVAVRSVEGQQMQALHRVRDLWMKQRIALSNQIRGLLCEFGEVIPLGFKRLKQDIAAWQARAGVELVTLKELIVQLMHVLQELEERIRVLEVRIRQQHKGNAASRLIESIPGVGLLSATAVVASFGRCESFESARKFSCCLGLTPREHSSGGKQMLLGITKRGNGYVRKLLIHGARAVLKVRMNNAAYAEDWVVKLAKRRGHNIAAVALAAKNARRIWA